VQRIRPKIYSATHYHRHSAIEIKTLQFELTNARISTARADQGECPDGLPEPDQSHVVRTKWTLMIVNNQHFLIFPEHTRTVHDSAPQSRRSASRFQTPQRHTPLSNMAISTIPSHHATPGALRRPAALCTAPQSGKI
jgi:hypothetical protein